MKTAARIIALGLVAFVGTAPAGNPPATLTMIPPLINYQGRLVAPDNTPYSDNNHVIDLTLYPTASGGTKLWSERYTVPTKDGYFSVNLGSGGTGLLATNLPIWQVMWKNTADAQSPDIYFMALTVRSRPNGTAEPNPVEATPRQQFLTTPFAYRAHQSVYASKADGVFSAPQGVQTTNISSTTSEIGMNRALRLPVGYPLYANRVEAHGTSPSLRLLAAGGPITMGYEYSSVPPLMGYYNVSPTINIGATPSSLLPTSGTDIYLRGKSVSITTTNLTVNNKPLFVRKAVVANPTSTVSGISHGLDTGLYDVSVVGWYYAHTSPTIRGVYTSGQYIQVYFTAQPSGGQLTLYLLGVQKGLVEYQ